MNYLKLIFLFSLIGIGKSNPIVTKTNSNPDDEGYNQLKEGHFLDVNVLNTVKDIILKHEQLESNILNSYMTSVHESNGYNFIPQNNIVDIQFASVNPSLQVTQFRQQNTEKNNPLYKNDKLENFQPTLAQIPTSVLPIESKKTRLQPVNSYGKFVGPIKLPDITEFNENHSQNLKEIKSLNQPIIVDDEDHVVQLPSNQHSYSIPFEYSTNSRNTQNNNIQVQQSQSYQMPTTSVQIKEYYTFSQSPAIEILTGTNDKENKKVIENLDSEKTTNDKNNDNDSFNSDIHYIITPLEKRKF